MWLVHLSEAFKMSDKTLAKASDKKVLYNHFYYRSLVSKLQCV
jgi:hypothetical protein